MPTYDYACNACDHRFEHFQSFSEARLQTCPECGKDALERLIGGGGGILFKGSGFYETDYKRPAKPACDNPSPPAGGCSGGGCPAAPPGGGPCDN